MATYKVIQDIEAEDKFVGPLTLKQFIFAMGGVFFGWLSFFAVAKGFPWALSIFLPPTLFGFFMAFPWSREQPTDVWVLAKIRFRFKPKNRIWDQSGAEDLVTITAPKKIDKTLVNDISQTEVKSRLKILADTIDSRGWAVKNASLQDSLAQYAANNDRLVDVSILPQQVPAENLATIPDMMEDHTMDQLMIKQDTEHKALVLQNMDHARKGEPINVHNTSPEPVVEPDSSQIAPPSSDRLVDENDLAQMLKAKKAAGDSSYKNMASIPVFPSAGTTAIDDARKPEPQKAKSTEVEKAQASVTEQVSPDILGLAQNNDLDVATIARQAKKDKNDEVVVSLH